MAYTAYDKSKPVTSPDTRQASIDSIRNNLNASRDAVIAGDFSGWNYSKVNGTGTADKPQYIYYQKGTGGSAEIIRLTFTWGTSGGADGNPLTITYAYSSNNGGSYDNFAPYATCTYAYDVDGNLVSTTWS